MGDHDSYSDFIGMHAGDVIRAIYYAPAAAGKPRCGRHQRRIDTFQSREPEY